MRKLIISSVALLLWLTACGARPSRQAKSVQDPESIARPRAEPYHGDPSIFDDPKRDRELEIEQTMDRLGIEPGAVVADIGAGSGYFAFHAARRVGERGLVYAVDIQQSMLDYINERAKKERVANVRTVLGEEANPRLPAQAIDVAMILKTYHELAAPVALLRQVRAALKDGGRLAIIDEDKPELREQARRVLDRREQIKEKTSEHVIAREFVIAEAERAGFKLVAERELPGEQNYFLLFVPAEVR